MGKWVIMFCFLLSFSCPAQTNPPTTPTSSTSTSTTSSASPASQTTTSSGGRSNPNTVMRDYRAIDEAFENLRNLEIPQNFGKPQIQVISEEISPLYRKPNKKELKNLSPSQALLSKYAQFLEQPNTGIFKLSADSSCVSNPKVIIATEKCLLNNIPGSGTAYSFRVRSHRMLHLSDLILDKNVIKTDSALQQGLMVNLGNIELDEITTQTKGLKYLLDFKPAVNREELLKINEKLTESVKADGFIYTYGLYVEDKATFALRSIAYRGKLMRSVSGVDYNEFSYDKRKDIVIIFRILEKEANGDITILWKELSQQDSPMIKPEKKK